MATATDTFEPAASSATRVGVVDLGRRSTRMLVADVRAGAVEELERRWLGAGAESPRDALAALEDYARSMDARECSVRELVLTGGSQDSREDQALAAELRERYGAPVRVLDAMEERNLTFQGATIGLSLEHPTLFLDIGGSATNVMIARHGRVEFGAAIRLGVRRQTREFLKHDPPDPDELRMLRWEAAWRIGLAQPDGPTPACGQAVAVLDAPSWKDSALRLHRLEPSGGAGFNLTRETCEWAIEGLAIRSANQRAAIPGLDPARAGTILAGAVILLETMCRFGLDSVLVSRRDLLDGLALQRAEVAA